MHTHVKWDNASSRHKDSLKLCILHDIQVSCRVMIRQTWNSKMSSAPLLTPADLFVLLHPNEHLSYTWLDHLRSISPFGLHLIWFQKSQCVLLEPQLLLQLLSHPSSTCTFRPQAFRPYPLFKTNNPKPIVQSSFRLELWTDGSSSEFLYHSRRLLTQHSGAS